MLLFAFAASIALTAFAYFGYPLVIAVWARIAPKPPRRDAYTPAVTIIVVGHNEAHTIRAKIESCLGQSYPPAKLGVLVVSDGSTDETATIVRGMGARVRLLAFTERRGKAACLNDAMNACQDEIVVLSDARQPLDPRAVACLLENFADRAVGAASGELCLRTDDTTGFGEGIDAYWRYEKFIRKQESTVASTVGVTGALYALRRALWRPIPPQTILDDVLSPMNVVLQGYRVLFDNRALAWDRPSASPGHERLRKVRTLAGNFQLLALRPGLLLPWRNPIFVQFFCHKVLRLLVPVFLVSAMICNFVLALRSNAWAMVLTAHVGGYGLAIAGALAPKLCRWLPVKLATTFLLLNCFVVLGFIDFVRNKNAHLWRTHGSAA
ncbi:MAG: glycosyltransferase family 2 protein [Rhodanobacteraceae bacterium]